MKMLRLFNQVELMTDDLDVNVSWKWKEKYRNADENVIQVNDVE